MILKTNLHLHAEGDPEDYIPYTFEQALERAETHGFHCIALTCHDKLFDNESLHRMAETHGILFIPGIEKNVEGKHVVVLNPTKEIETIETFEELRAYRHAHPEIFIIAPHPYFPGGYSLQRKLMKNADIFDAIEHSWFYSPHWNRNTRAQEAAKKLQLPFIATSDLHDLRFMNTNYAEIEVDSPSIEHVFTAIRNRKFTNTTSPRRLWREMAAYMFRRVIAERGKKPR